MLERTPVPWRPAPQGAGHGAFATTAAGRPGIVPEWARAFAAEIETTLHDIAFDEVTLEDRITFVECAVAFRARLAEAHGLVDLASVIRRFGARRVAELRAWSPPGHPPERP